MRSFAGTTAARCGWPRTASPTTVASTVTVAAPHKLPTGGRGPSLMPRCAGIKRDGGRCTAIVNGSQTHCYQHDPARAEERRRNASRAARAKPARELTQVKQRLSELADDVLEGRKDKGVAAVASQVLNVYLRAVSVELKAREQLELVERLEALEEGLEQSRGGGSRWRA